MDLFGSRAMVMSVVSIAACGDDGSSGTVTDGTEGQTGSASAADATGTTGSADPCAALGCAQQCNPGETAADGPHGCNAAGACVPFDEVDLAACSYCDGLACGASCFFPCDDDGACAPSYCDEQGVCRTEAEFVPSMCDAGSSEGSGSESGSGSGSEGSGSGSEGSGSGSESGSGSSGG